MNSQEAHKIQAESLLKRRRTFVEKMDVRIRSQIEKTSDSTAVFPWHDTDSKEDLFTIKNFLYDCTGYFPTDADWSWIFSHYKSEGWKVMYRTTERYNTVGFWFFNRRQVLSGIKLDLILEAL